MVEPVSMAILGAFAVGATISAIGGGCMDLGIASFGCSKKQVLSDEKKFENSLEVRTKKKASSNIKKTTTNIQRIKFEAPKGAKIGTLNATQTIGVKLKYITKVDNKMETVVKQIIDERIDEAFKNLTDIQRSFLSATTDVESMTELKKSFKNSVKIDDVAEILDDIQEVTISEQEMLFYLPGSTKKITLDQDIGVSIYSYNVLTRVVKLMVDNKHLTKIISRVEQLVKEKGANILDTLFGESGKWVLLAGGLFALWYFFGRGERSSSSSPVVVIPGPTAAQPPPAAPPPPAVYEPAQTRTAPPAPSKRAAPALPRAPRPRRLPPA